MATLMFNHFFKKVCVICICTLLNACTLMVWDAPIGRRDSHRESVTILKYKKEKLIQKDQLLGFALLQEQATATPSKLMIMGKHYAYQIDKGSDEVQSIIHSKLDMKEWGLVANQSAYESLKVVLIEPENKQKQSLNFRGTIEFFYQNEHPDADVVAELKRLGASLTKVKLATGETIDLYSKSIDLEGEVVGLNQQMKSLDYQNFGRQYWIEIYQPAQRVDGVNYKVLLKKVALTPFALVTDVVLIPIILIKFGVAHLATH